MGFFSRITGQDAKVYQYNKTFGHCLRSIREVADDMGVNLNDYYNTRNSDSFQEKSMLYFLANAAIVDQDEKGNIIQITDWTRGLLNDVLNEFLRENGIRSMSLVLSRPEIHNYVLSQGLFARDFILAEKNNPNESNRILTAFIQSMIDEKSYYELHQPDSILTEFDKAKIESDKKRIKKNTLPNH